MPSFVHLFTVLLNLDLAHGSNVQHLAPLLTKPAKEKMDGSHGLRDVQTECYV